MNLEDVYESTEVCKLEEKFLLSRKSDTEFIGNYHLEPLREKMRGVYGGEMIAQSLRAAWDSIDDREFEIHSMHSYFLKAGKKDSVMRYEVTTLSQGRSFCSRLVKCFQLHDDQLCFSLMASFMRNNNVAEKRKRYWALLEVERRSPKTKIPLEFLSRPHYTFFKYGKGLDSMPVVEHTHGNLSHIIPPETFHAPEGIDEGDSGSRVFGLFFKVNDNVGKAHNKVKTKMIDFAYASDSLYLATIMRAISPSLDFSKSQFFRVSLDHSIFYHDTNFDPTEWMFLDYKFERCANDRVLVTSRYFTMDSRLVATALQEALCLFPLPLIESIPHGTYKL